VSDLAELVQRLRKRIAELERERDEALQIAEGPSTLKELAAGSFERAMRIAELEADPYALVPPAFRAGFAKALSMAATFIEHIGEGEFELQWLADEIKALKPPLEG